MGKSWEGEKKQGGGSGKFRYLERGEGTETFIRLQ